MGIPEILEVCTSAFLYCKINHYEERGSHYPTGDTRSSRKVGSEKNSDLCSSARTLVRCSQPGKVHHVGQNMDNGEKDDRPSRGLMESDVLVERNDVVQWCPTEKGNEVPADGEEDEGDINVQNKGSSTSDRCKLFVKKSAPR
jgi:hypothetical protein